MIRAAITGRLGGDPVQRETRAGKAMVTASVAIDVGQPGKEPISEWISIVAFGTAGEALARHGKGDLVSAMGPLTKSAFTDRDGNERSSWSLLAESLLSARTTYGPQHDTAARPRRNRPAARFYSPPPNRSGPVPDLVDDDVSQLFRESVA